MLKRFGQSLRLGIARDSISLVRVSRWRRPATTVLAELPLDNAAGATAEQCLQHLCQVLPVLLPRLLAHAATGSATASATKQPYAHWPLTVVLADDLVRLWPVTPPAGASRLADLEAAAALRFHSLFGEPLSGWRMMADWDVRATFFAAAIPATLLTLITQQAQQHQLVLMEMAPQFILAWNQWRAALLPGAWFALLHDEVLTVGVTSTSRLSAVRSTLLPSGDVSFTWLQTYLQREALLLNVAPPTQLQICGVLPEQWPANAGAGQIACTRLNHARRGLPPLSAGAMLAQTGARS
ncbi:hypothetical protein BH11PSE12_BH11PSE12_06110 [soil metagenome]